MPVTRSKKTSSARTQPVRSTPKARTHAKPVKRELWAANDLEGDFPPLTVHSKTVTDASRGKVYVYGGCMLGDEAEMPMPYLHVFDTATKKFTDLTYSLTFVTPGDPYSDAMLKREVKLLPALSQPGVVLVELRGHPVILLYGGYDAGEDEGPSSALIAINTSHKEWYYVEFEDNEFAPPSARIDPILVGVHGKLYIFGGLEAFGQAWAYHRTYSIVDFQLGARTHKCKWLMVDTPYPDTVPVNQIFGKGLPVQNGVTILLLPGREQATSHFNFRRDNVFYFITMNNTFQQADVTGELPRQIHWYYACNLDPTVAQPGSSSSSAPNSSSPSVLLCTWIPHGPEDLSPEFWQFKTYPENRFIRLNVQDRIYALEKNFQRFALVGSRAFLMGQGDDAVRDEDAMCDTYVEIPLRNL